MTYRTACGQCGRTLDGVDEAYVCGYDCTFCSTCASGPDRVCPNCGGELVRRPRRKEVAGPRTRGPAASAATEVGASVRLPPAGEVPPLGAEGSGWRVARATLDDLDDAVVLFDRYRQFYRQPRDPTGCREFLSRRLARDESLVYLARSGTEAVGFLQLYPTFSSITLQRLWILNDLYVLPEHRRLGVASELLRVSQELAQETSSAGVILDTAVDNPAQKLYEARGWKLDREFLHYEWSPPR